MEAIQGVRGIMPSTMTKVPISDMTTVMSVVPKKIPGKFYLLLESGIECIYFHLLINFSISHNSQTE